MSHSLNPMYHPSRRWEVLVYLAADGITLPRLPTEIWERILDELGSSTEDSSQSQEVFAACCLVCRAWLPRSRYHLFEFLRVQSKEQVKQMSTLLNSIPALRTRVKTLTVHGSGDAGKDAPWIDRVGFHLGPKLKALHKIEITNVDFSFIKPEFYKFWGTFNRSWHSGATRELGIQGCTVTHLNQLIRLAFVTKAWELYPKDLKPSLEQVESIPPIPVFPSGISLPLRKFTISLHSSDLALPVEWHRLARQCPSLFKLSVYKAPNAMLELNLSSSAVQLFLVSIFSMFRRMQRHSAINDVGIEFSNIRLEVRTQLHDLPSNSGVASRGPRPCIRRELVLDLAYFWVYRKESPMEVLSQVLARFEDSMAPGENNADRGFHRIEIVHLDTYRPQPNHCQSLDTLLSHLRVTTPDVRIVIVPNPEPHMGCVLPWVREHFPRFTQLHPNAFCDADASRPCRSHFQNVSGGRGRVEEMQVDEEARLEVGAAQALPQEVGIRDAQGDGETRAESEVGPGPELGPASQGTEMDRRQEKKTTRQSRLTRKLREVIPRLRGIAHKLWRRNL